MSSDFEDHPDLSALLPQGSLCSFSAACSFAAGHVVVFCCRYGRVFVQLRVLGLGVWISGRAHSLTMRLRTATKNRVPKTFHHVTSNLCRQSQNWG